MLATMLLLAFCSLAAYVAIWLGLPLPYMLGPLLASTTLALTAKPWLPKEYPMLGGLRFVFIAVIGVLIGTQVTPELFAEAHHLAWSAVAILVFVVVSITYNFTIFRRIGGYDTPTALYAGMPGGLYESIALGEEAGADPARLMLQQFLRVIVVVTLVPIGLSLWLGEAVGTAGGMTLAKADVAWSTLPVTAAAILAGIALGHVLRLPARQLTGPMAVGAALSLTGMIEIDIPQWLINLSLIVIGTALGTRFTTLSRRQVAQGLGLAAMSVGGMLVLAGLIAFILGRSTGQAFDVMFVSFAPGGVTEMTLVALSLSGNPAIVTLHHITRILITVLVMVGSTRWIRRRL